MAASGALLVRLVVPSFFWLGVWATSAVMSGQPWNDSFPSCQQPSMPWLQELASGRAGAAWHEPWFDYGCVARAT